MTPRPILDWVCIDRFTTPNITKGGIHLPTQTGRKKSTEGIVLSIGKGKKNKKDGHREPMQCKPGDKVIFRQYDVEKVKEITDENGKPYIFVRDEEVVAIICDNQDI